MADESKKPQVPDQAEQMQIDEDSMADVKSLEPLLDGLKVNGDGEDGIPALERKDSEWFSEENEVVPYSKWLEMRFASIHRQAIAVRRQRRRLALSERRARAGTNLHGRKRAPSLKYNASRRPRRSSRRNPGVGTKKASRKGPVRRPLLKRLNGSTVSRGKIDRNRVSRARVGCKLQGRKRALSLKYNASRRPRRSSRRNPGVGPKKASRKGSVRRPPLKRLNGSTVRRGKIDRNHVRRAPVRRQCIRRSRN